MGSASRPLAVRLVAVATWIWILYTMVPVLRYGGAVVFDPSTTGRIFGARSGNTVRSAVLLTYHGVGGVVLLAVEVAAVTLALIWTRSASAAKRRFGGGVLVAWTAVWVGNSIWMEWLTGGRHPARTTLSIVALVVVLVHALLLARRTPSTAGRRGFRPPLRSL